MIQGKEIEATELDWGKPFAKSPIKFEREKDVPFGPALDDSKHDEHKPIEILDKRGNKIPSTLSREFHRKFFFQTPKMIAKDAKIKAKHQAKILNEGNENT